jgi:hypothetical protein
LATTPTTCIGLSISPGPTSELEIFVDAEIEVDVELSASALIAQLFVVQPIIHVRTLIGPRALLAVDLHALVRLVEGHADMRVVVVLDGHALLAQRIAGLPWDLHLFACRILGIVKVVRVRCIVDLSDLGCGH